MGWSNRRPTSVQKVSETEQVKPVNQSLWTKCRVALRLATCLFWGLFILWMLCYSMPLSAVYAASFLFCLLYIGRVRWWVPTLILALSPFVIWNVGLVEYSRKTIDLHCRVAGYTGAGKAAFCAYAPDAYAQGKSHKKGMLFSTRERLAVHGFNSILAAGGLMAGLPEVAWETLRMSFSPEPLKKPMAAQARKTRIAQCKGGGRGTQTHPEAVSKGNGDFLLDSSTIRRMVAAKAGATKRLPPGKERRWPARKVQFKAPKQTNAAPNDNKSYYGALMRSDNLKAPITLVVPDGKLHLKGINSGDEPIFEVKWSGTISYPPNAYFEFPLPTVWGLPGINRLTGVKKPFPVVLSEGIFCGMTIDGAMNPYRQEWATTIAVSDPRLTPKGRQQSVHGWIEWVLGWVM